MRVAELIEELQKCNPNDLVMYDMENGFLNSGYERYEEEVNKYITEEGLGMGVDEVMIGSGTAKGFVYLCEKLLED